MNFRFLRIFRGNSLLELLFSLRNSFVSNSCVGSSQGSGLCSSAKFEIQKMREYQKVPVLTDRIESLDELQSFHYCRNCCLCIVGGEGVFHQTHNSFP